MDSLFAFSARCLAAVGFWTTVAPSNAVEVPLNESSVIRFVDVREGIQSLVRPDEYIRQLSPFDRQVRLRTDREVSEEEFLDFAASHVRPWTPQDVEKLTPRIVELAAKIKPWKLKLPPVILLVKTSGIEESRAAYCRGASIVLPANITGGPVAGLRQILPHELFHILSSHNPTLRETLYETIGFKSCNEVQLPDGLAQRKITNPDAPVNDHFLTATVNGRRVELMPILFSKTDRYDRTRNDGLFSYLTFKLMVLSREGEMRAPLLSQGQAVLLDPKSVPDFATQAGRNTAYMIHPEEILADNFVFLLNGRIDLPSPQVVQQMGKVLQAAAE